MYFQDICYRDNATGLITVTNNDKKQEFENLVNKQLEEGRTLRALHHKNIVKTRGIFKENNTAYMVMDYVDGQSLEGMLQAGGIRPQKALAYIRQVLSAVIYIHERKILHLDITPDNILIDKMSDSAVLVDFGASLRYGENSHVASTTSKMVTGFKKHYAPNEQTDIANLKEFDATFDTYAIGATLYHLLTNHQPPLSSMISSGRARLEAPSKFASTGEVSELMDEIIFSALNPMYHQRFKSAIDMNASFEQEASYRRDLDLIYKLLDDRKYTEALDWAKKAAEQYNETAALKTAIEQSTSQVEEEAGGKTSVLKPEAPTAATKIPIPADEIKKPVEEVKTPIEIVKNTVDIKKHIEEVGDNQQPYKLNFEPMFEQTKATSNKIMYICVAVFIIFIIGVIVFAIANSGHHSYDSNYSSLDSAKKDTAMTIDTAKKDSAVATAYKNMEWTAMPDSIKSKYTISKYYTETYEGLFIVKKANKYGFIDTKGKVVIPFMYENANRMSEGLAAVQLNELYGYINRYNKMIIKCKYDYAKPFSEGYGIVTKNGADGVVDTTGKLIIPFKYSMISIFREGLASVELHYKYGFIDAYGNVVIPMKYTFAGNFYDGKAEVEIADKKMTINKKGEVIQN